MSCGMWIPPVNGSFNFSVCKALIWCGLLITLAKKSVFMGDIPPSSARWHACIYVGRVGYFDEMNHMKVSNIPY